MSPTAKAASSSAKSPPKTPMKAKKAQKPPSTHAGPSLSPAQAAGLAAGHGYKLTELVTISPSGQPSPGACYWHGGSTEALSTDDREAVAWLLAHEIIRSRTGGNSSFDLWLSAALSGTTLAEDDAKRVRPFIRPVFGLPPKGKDIGHVAGYVAEWLWYLHATELADAARAPLYLEPPSGQVTAPGHDGFVIYEQTADQQTIFRLWEVKKHDSSASATSVVKRATTQLNKFGDDYLAQLTAPLSERTDAVGDMAREMVDLWVDADPRAGAGVSITSTTTPPPPPDASTASEPP